MSPTTNAESVSLLIDELMPRFDASRVDHLVVDGQPEAVFSAVRDADFVEAWTSSRAVRLLFAARAGAEWLAARARGRDPVAKEEIAAMRLADMPKHGEWVLLGENSPHEIAFGVIGRFWAGETVWRQTDSAEFAGFNEPRWARVACNFSLRPYGTERTLVSYETRTQGTDSASTRAFLRYWRLVSPLAGVVLRSQLSVVARAAQRQAQQFDEQSPVGG